MDSNFAIAIRRVNAWFLIVAAMAVSAAPLAGQITLQNAPQYYAAASAVVYQTEAGAIIAADRLNPSPMLAAVVVVENRKNYLIRALPEGSNAARRLIELEADRWLLVGNRGQRFVVEIWFAAADGQLTYETQTVTIGGEPDPAPTPTPEPTPPGPEPPADEFGNLGRRVAIAAAGMPGGDRAAFGGFCLAMVAAIDSGAIKTPDDVERFAAVYDLQIADRAAFEPVDALLLADSQGRELDLAGWRRWYAAAAVGFGLKPPTPPPNPAPIPAAGLRVLIIYESGDASTIPAGQLAAINAADVRQWCRANCIKDTAGVPQFRVVDQNAEFGAGMELFAEAMKRPRASLPWVIVSNGSAGFEGPVPGSVAEMLALLERFK